MIKHRTWLAVLPLAATVVASCAGHGPSPDPVNRILHALATDPVFAKLPPGAVRTGWQEKPAKWRRTSLFTGGGWDGPAVIETFTSSQSVRDVYRFYAQRAAEGCWTPYQKLSPGFTRSWLKRTTETLSSLGLYGNFDIHSVNLTEAGTPRSYTLNAAGTRLPKNGPQPKGLPLPPAHAQERCGRAGSTPGETPTR